MRRLVLLVMVGACAGRTAVPATKIPARYRAWLALYDAAGLPDVRGARRLDRLAGVTSLGNGRAVAVRSRMWRLADGRILRDHLRIEPYYPMDRHFADVEDGEPVEREVDYLAELRAELGRERSPEELVIRACWAAQRGDDSLALRALAAADHGFAGECTHLGCDAASRVRGYLQSALVGQATADLGSGSPRADVLAALRRAEQLAPGAFAAGAARKLAAGVELALAQERAFVPPTDEALRSMGAGARAALLASLLREQSGLQEMNPGGINTLFARPGTRNVAVELVALGRAAVPALLERLDDDTLTRSIDMREGVQTVGAAARQALEAIAERSFADKAAALAWWSATKDLGEVAAWEAELERAPDADRSRIAEKLAARLGPAASFDAIERAFQRTADPYARASLFRALRRGGDPRLLGVARQALRDRHAPVRFEAASLLAERGDPSWIDVILADLRAFPTPDLPGFPEMSDDYHRLLLASSDPRARRAILDTARTGDLGALASLANAVAHECKPSCRAVGPEVEDALVERAIAGGAPPSWYAKTDWRVRDVAAGMLGQLRGRATNVKDRPTRLERDQETREVVNELLRARGRPPAAFPEADVPTSAGPPLVVRVARDDTIDPTSREVSSAWIAAHLGQPLQAARLVEDVRALARRVRGTGWTVRVTRLPRDRSLILDVYGEPMPPNGSSDKGLSFGFSCAGTSLCMGGRGGFGTDEGLADNFRAIAAILETAWSGPARFTEEYTLRFLYSSP